MISVYEDKVTRQQLVEILELENKSIKYDRVSVSQLVRKLIADYHKKLFGGIK